MAQPGIFPTHTQKKGIKIYIFNTHTRTRKNKNKFYRDWKAFVIFLSAMHSFDAMLNKIILLQSNMTFFYHISHNTWKSYSAYQYHSQDPEVNLCIIYKKKTKSSNNIIKKNLRLYKNAVGISDREWERN